MSTLTKILGQIATASGVRPIGIVLNRNVMRYIYTVSNTLLNN